MDQKPKSYIKKKVKRGKYKEISSYELLLRNSHELLWRKLSEYTVLSLGVVRVKVWFPDLKLASSIKLERSGSVDSAINYIARKKKITNPHCGLYLERHGECGIWLVDTTPLWLYDIQASDVLEFKPRPSYTTSTFVIRVFIVEQKAFKSVLVDKQRKVCELVASFQNQFGLIKGDLSYYGFNLLTPEANEIWLEDDSTLSSYLIHNMSVVEYKRKPLIVLEPATSHPSSQTNCTLHQNVSVLEATITIVKWLMPDIDIKQFEEQGLFYVQQNLWMEKDTPIGVYPLKANDVISVGLMTSDNPESLANNAPPRKNLVKNQKIAALPGEVPVFKVSNVIHLSNFTSYVPATLSGGIVGDIIISNYRLTFSALQSPEVSIEIPVASISKVEKKGKNKNEIFYGYFLDILCKDNRLVRFYWPQHDDSRKKLCQTLKQLAFPGDQLKLFAFSYLEEFGVDGWSIYNFEAEYERQKISPKMWRISHLNANYQMCETYPPLLAVPARISDEQLREVFQFRSKGRIPVMTWQHPTNGTTISRCSQPLSGIRVTRCTEDEALIKALGYSARSLIVDKLEKDLYVLDCRPKANALGNRAKGAEFLDIGLFTLQHCCTKLTAEIGNIHVMRESYEKLLDICLTAVGGAPGGGWSGSGPSGWLLALESTKWLDHTCIILKAAERVVDCIHNQEISVLLHCSDGWDRTAQVGSLALILLDPYHRTTRGFALLIEKEWLAFGHKFAQRNGHGESKHIDERSPVFIQFLDCVWQIMQQFPYAFEFNESFLLAILNHLHSCRFGTFLFNCHRERIINHVREKTPSVWSMLLSPPHVHEYANLFPSIYEPQDSVLQPNVSPRYIQLWTRAHLSWYCSIPPSVDNKLRLHAQNQARTIENLTRQIEELKSQIDPSRTKSPSLPKSSSDLKYSDTPLRMINNFSKHGLRTTLHNRTNSGNLNASGSLNNSDSGYLVPHPHFSTSLSTGLIQLSASGSEPIISSELMHSSTMLRGDSPFQRFRDDSSTSSEDDSDDEDLYSSASSADYENSSASSSRSSSVSSRRHLEVHVSNSPSSSFSTSHSSFLRSPSNSVSNPSRQMNKKSASSSSISGYNYASNSPPVSPPTSPRIIPRSPKLHTSPTHPPFSDSMEEHAPPTLNVAAYLTSNLSNSGGYPRARGDSKFTNVAGMTNVANYISHNYSLSDSAIATLAPRNPPNPPSPDTEEPKWLRRSPSSKSLNFLDQQRRLPPTINPNRFSST